MRSQRPLGHGGVSKFDLILQRRELSFRRALIAYLGAASEFTGALFDGSETLQYLCHEAEPEITIVLSPVITVPRHEDKATRFIGEQFAMVMLVGELLHFSYVLQPPSPRLVTRSKR